MFVTYPVTMFDALRVVLAETDPWFPFTSSVIYGTIGTSLLYGMVVWFAIKVYPKLQVYNVFNVAAQTNLEVTRPEMYEKLKAQAAGHIQQQSDLKSHPAIDLMIDENIFFCPINQVKGDRAYYSPANDHIVVPKREQFVDGEAFATNTLHECAHATGADSRLDRHLGGHSFGSPEYAREELIAEL